MYQNLSRLQRRSGRMYVWIGTLCFLLWAWAAVVFCYTLSFAFAPPEAMVAQPQGNGIVYGYSSSFWPNWTNFTVPAGLFVAPENIRIVMLLGMLLQAILISVTALGIAGIWRMFGSMQLEHSPFTFPNVQRLRRAARIAVWTPPLWWFLDCCGMTYLYKTPRFSFTMDRSFFFQLLLFVVGLALFAVSLAFEHGAVLQQESDETL